MQKRKLLILSVLPLVLLVLIAGTVPGNRFFEIARNIEIYSALFKTVNEIYVDEVNPNKLLSTSVDAMLNTLDPYTVYISEDKIEDYRTQSTGQYGGIGASTIRINGRVFISNVVPNGPADAAGIEVGDEVISASGVNVLGKSNEVLNQLVRGQAKTTIQLGIRKNGSDSVRQLSVLRDKITIENVPFSGLVTENIGYIKFTQFTENGARNIGKALKNLKKEGANAIILDLRNNPGGLLKEAVGICNLFLPKDKLIVETRGKRPENTTVWKTQNQPLDTKIPVVVLVNSSSASASGIVSGTLQDYDRAVIMGQKSFGKGLVQNVRPLSFNAQLKVTIAKYYTPSGRCIQALDYTHRNQNGSVGKVPDSLKTAFKTQAGRVVYDGGGVDPDITTPKLNWSPLLIKLIQEGYIYLYANAYKLAHKQIEAPDRFNLTDEDYRDFISWMETQEFSFESKLETKLNNLNKLTDQAPGHQQKVKETLEELAQEVHQPLEQLLLSDKPHIKEMLETEIALRYYSEAGSIQTSLAHDNEVAQAIALLNNTTKYNSILHPGF